MTRRVPRTDVMNHVLHAYGIAHAVLNASSVCVCVCVCVCARVHYHVDSHSVERTAHGVYYMCSCVYVYLYMFHMSKCIQ